MVDVPPEIPVTNPVLLTVATAGFEDNHGVVAAGVPDPVSCVVPPTHFTSVPVMVGNGFTVTLVEALVPKLSV